MNAIQFQTVEKPAVVRNTAPNPFADAVKGLLTEDGKPTDKALSFTLPINGEKDKKINSVSRQLRETGRPLNVTVRQTKKISDDGKSVTFTFWTVERITHADASASDNGTTETGSTEAPAPEPETAAPEKPAAAKKSAPAKK